MPNFAGLAKQQGMALWGHQTPDALRGYVNNPKAQRTIAGRKRRVLVEQTGDIAQNEARVQAQNEKSDAI